jgi:hypothetical protein
MDRTRTTFDLFGRGFQRLRSIDEHNFDTGRQPELRANNDREGPIGPMELRMNILARLDALMGLDDAKRGCSGVQTLSPNT